MPFTLQQVLKAWDDAAGARQAMDRRAEYYAGRHAILGADAERMDGSRATRVVTNWIEYIVNMHVGFLTSKAINVTPKDEAASRVAFDALAEVRERCTLDAVDVENLKNAILFGYGVEVHSYGDQGPVIKEYDPRRWAFIWDSDGGMRAAIYRTVIEAGTVHRGEYLTTAVDEIVVYDERTITTWRATQLVTGFVRAAGDASTGDGFGKADEVEHFYGRLPVVLFAVNKARESHIKDALLDQQDNYNKIRCSNTDDVLYNADALLALIGYNAAAMLIPDEQGKTQIDKIRELRLIPLDKDGDAKFLEKGNEVQKVAHELGLSRDAIHLMGGVPDLHAIVGTSGQISGIALRLKFEIMIFTSDMFIKYFARAYRERLELLNKMFAIKGQPVLRDYVVTVNRNVPQQETELIQNIPFLRQVLSQLDTLRLLPFVEDPEASSKAKDAEREAEMELAAKQAETAAALAAKAAPPNPPGTPGRPAAGQDAPGSKKGASK